jgi:hypothetical protein
VKLKGQIVSRLGGGIVDAYLKHRKTALQLIARPLGTFLGAELGLQATIDFESETVLWAVQSFGWAFGIRGRWQRPRARVRARFSSKPMDLIAVPNAKPLGRSVTSEWTALPF